MDTPPLLPDRVYGDWEFDEAEDSPGVLYPAKVTGSWPGGVCFLTDRATAERIVAQQEKMLAEFPALVGETTVLAWDGDTLVATYDDDYAERIEPDSDGLYDCSFGWCWSEYADAANASPNTADLGGDDA